jgi:hypothetical protein
LLSHNVICSEQVERHLCVVVVVSAEVHAAESTINAWLSCNPVKLILAQ